MNTLTRPCATLEEETTYVESHGRGYRPGDGETTSPDSEMPAFGSDGLRAPDALDLEFLILALFLLPPYDHLYTTAQSRQ